MLLGLSLAAFTGLHVVISLLALAVGALALAAMVRGALPTGRTALFLALTIATSVTGFMFPYNGFLPSHAFGVLSLVLLALACAALYGRRLAGRWRLAFVVGAVMAQYLNAFVAVVQGFQKIGFLHALAPTQSEPPFAIAQGLLLLGCLWLGWAVNRGLSR
ncbi:hypothetical protein EOD42_16150 [Rhodovarius crocodyli]|uniref:DUF2306 domain-containing protein n=2 Tax=Rhodovarius crocodyli TaxID=1979269 RepID=A0A437ME15_9PROT|nr:hypothetical protein EOD42_16150 [Rhodovarius crocodyli]